jgi:hypothetical protein
VTGGPGTCLSAGGVVAVITVYTNTGSGQSTVLPVRVKMFDDVVGTPQWWAITNGVFGSNVTVLPFQDVSAPQGYMLYWPEHHNPYGYPTTYSSVYPIIIESSSGGTWSNEFYFCLYGVSTAVAGCGPCQVSSGESKGIVEAFLYDGSNTNGLDNTIAGTTNSIMGRFGLDMNPEIKRLEERLQALKDQRRIDRLKREIAEIDGDPKHPASAPLYWSRCLL